MKLRFFTVALLGCCMLTGCGGAREDAAANNTAETAAALKPTTVVTKESSGLHALNETNSHGLYGIFADTEGPWFGTCFSFADTQEYQIDAPAGLPQTGRPATLLADEEHLYWSWSGLLTDTPTLVVTDLDGNPSASVTFPQGWFLTGWEAMAVDGPVVYAKGGIISADPHQLDDRRLLRLDTVADTIETVTTWDQYGGSLLGVWDGKLLLTRRVIAPACPVEPVYNYYHIDNFDELKPYLTETLCTLDPTNGSEAVLAEGPVYTFGQTRKLHDDAFWWVDELDRLLCQPLGESEPQVVAELPQAMSIVSIYDEDMFLLCLDDSENGSAQLMVYHFADGTLSESPLRRARKYEESYIDVVCQTTPGEYLIIEGENPVQRTLTGTGGDPYTITTTIPQYALASRAAILDASIPTVPVEMGEWRR